jgi:hypothetical protein
MISTMFQTRDAEDAIVKVATKLRVTPRTEKKVTRRSQRARMRRPRELMAPQRDRDSARTAVPGLLAQKAKAKSKPQLPINLKVIRSQEKAVRDVVKPKLQEPTVKAKRKAAKADAKRVAKANAKRVEDPAEKAEEAVIVVELKAVIAVELKAVIAVVPKVPNTVRKDALTEAEAAVIAVVMQAVIVVVLKAVIVVAIVAVPAVVATHTPQSTLKRRNTEHSSSIAFSFKVATRLAEPES